LRLRLYGRHAQQRRRTSHECPSRQLFHFSCPWCLFDIFLFRPRARNSPPSLVKSYHGEVIQANVR
jgi:hypothetical protein